jgi:hypothetical protein
MPQSGAELWICVEKEEIFALHGCCFRNPEPATFGG